MNTMALSEMTSLFKTFPSCYVTSRYIITDPFKDRSI